MRSVKIAEVKAHLSEHLRYVRAGGRVRIYDRATPIAEIVPFVEEADPKSWWTASERADLIRRGLLRPARIPGGGKPLGPMRGRMDRASRASKALIEERRNGR